MRYRREIWLFVTMIAMMASLFISRALLSSAMIAFLMVSFFHRDFLKQLLHFISTPLLWAMTLLFLLPLISGAWSQDISMWNQVLRIKLPLLLLPLAFAGQWNFSQRKWDMIACIFIALMIIASGWTLFHYFRAAPEINNWYLQARTMITPLENDHVRFSWLAAIAAFLSGFYIVYYRSKSRGLTIVFLLILAWFMFFLHILAARTGLLALYLAIAGAAIWLIVRNLKWRTGIVLLLLIFLLPVLAYKYLPSFHNRADYIRYELDYFSKASYLPGSNDAVRMISMKAGWAVMLSNPFRGVGFGDISRATGNWYDEHYPGMTDRDRIYPSNQWLLYGAGTGIPGFVIFSFCMLVPFFVPVREKLLWYLLNVVAASSFLFDIGLEVQFGVFIYSFVILWWYKWLGRSET